MSNQRGQQNSIDTQVSMDDVTVTIFGESTHSNRDAHRCAELLAEVLTALEYKGEYSVVASMQRLKGSSSLQGLSTHGVSINAVLLGYQPNGNDTRATYTLPLASSEEAQNCFSVLKNHIGTAYDGQKKPKRQQTQALPASNQAPVSDVVVAAEPLVPTKPTEKPEVYYTRDAEWMETMVLLLSDVADEHPQHHVTKDQVLDLIVSRTHLPNRSGTAPIYRMFLILGYLVPIEGVEHTFKLVETPPAGYKSHGFFKRKPKSVSQKTPKVAATKVQSKVSPARKQKYLSDEEWMRSFMEGLRTLVSEAEGLVTRTDLYRFIKERTNQKKIAGMVYRVLEGLELRGLVIMAGEQLYRVVYKPKPDTLEKAVKDIEQVRAETNKVFDGFVHSRLPKFAEGMFANMQILDQFLRRLENGHQQARDLTAYLKHDYPSFEATYIRLLNYLVGQGYLLRLNRGLYALGPKGRERLGLPAIEYKIVEKTAFVPAKVAPPVIQTEIVLEPAAADSETTPSTQVFLSQEVSVPADSNVIAAIAVAIIKATAKKNDAEASEAKEAGLRVRRDELLSLKAQGPSPEVVEAAVMEKLVAMANNL